MWISPPPLPRFTSYPIVPCPGCPALSTSSARTTGRRLALQPRFRCLYIESVQTSSGGRKYYLACSLGAVPSDLSPAPQWNEVPLIAPPCKVCTNLASTTTPQYFPNCPLGQCPVDNSRVMHGRRLANARNRLRNRPTGHQLIDVVSFLQTWVQR